MLNLSEKENQMEKLLSAKEAAELTGLHPATLRKMAWQRRIRSYKVLGALRFRKSDLEGMITERPAEKPEGNQATPLDEMGGA